MPNVDGANITEDETVKRYAHEDTAAYARKLMNEMRIAQERLQSLIDENDPTVTVTATTAIPMDELLRVKAKSTDASVSAQLTAIHRELVRKRSQGGA